ncbi:cytochrome b/b6 domain-containing protein [Halalkalicoccus salilacus]|uniref:cytochrome b/b6 domain-containing protein n=1 Tax=Halalkalicoccus salilacus TaxID=3117459 RepID=UPI00300F1AC4
MTNLDHGKFSRVTTVFHSLLALTVFLLFFTGYSVAFNSELWWLVELMGGNQGVLAIHRIAGFALILLTSFWVLYMLLRMGGSASFTAVVPTPDDIAAFIQDVKFAFGMADERHPNARQFAGYSAEEIPMLSYIGKGVVAIFTVELLLLMISGLLIWQKTMLIDFYNSQSVVIAFVGFHGLLGVIMMMGVMFHTFEHTAHPAFYPVEMKAFLPKKDTPEYHGDEEADSATGIERLRLKSSWSWAANLLGALVVIGIVSVLIASMDYGGYPIPETLVFGEGSVLRTIGVNIGILVLFIGLFLSMYGNVLRARYMRQRREGTRGSTAATDGGEREHDERDPRRTAERSDDGERSTSERGSDGGRTDD